MKWVTREHVHVDRTACPWLIKQFVDKQAEFIFVPVEKIEEVVKKEGAIPFDAPNAELGHHDGKCSFDSVIAKYGIRDPAVLELAKIVRSADTDDKSSPEGAGLSAIMTGMSMVAGNDHEALKSASPVYDALLTYCKLKLLREQFKSQIEEMDRRQRREFLKKKLEE